MGSEAESWPPLADSHQQRSKNNDSAAKPPYAVAGDGIGTASPPPPSSEGSVAQQKSHGSGNPNFSHRYSSRHQKSGSRRNPNGGPPFPVPLPYVQPYMQPVFPAVIPTPYIPFSGYAYPPGPSPFPSAETQWVKSGAETSPAQPFVPPGNVQPPLRGDGNAYVVDFSTRRRNVGESGDHLNHPWHLYPCKFASKRQATEVPGVQNIHGPNEGWAWLARFLNCLPANMYTAVALNAFPQTAGYTLFRRYKSQFRKMLNIISSESLKALRESKDPELNPIIIEIQSYIEDDKFLQKPEGSTMQEQLLSSTAVPELDSGRARYY